MHTERPVLQNKTPITQLGLFENNDLFIKRDDLIPYSFGGNKARKAFLFFDEIEKEKCDCVVTYGSSHSNHCRIVANMAAKKNMKCYIIGPSEVSDDTFNSRFMKLFGAELITVPVEQVHDTIEKKLGCLQADGYKPYFIPGGGHGNIGTEAYVQCYKEIREYEQERGIHFDYIFFASGTGTTQAGLICGQIKYNDDRKIVGISIARKNPRGRDIVLSSIREYLPAASENIIQSKTIFVDDYIGKGYAVKNSDISETIKYVMLKYGIPLDSTYTAKAFWGMENYIKKKKIQNKTILFLHTGGTPLFFDDFNEGKL